MPDGITDGAVQAGTRLPQLRPGPQQRRMDLAAVVATFGGLLFGYDTGVLNGALDPMKKALDLTSTEEGFVVAILLIGAAVGSLVCGRLSDSIGRKNMLRALSIVFLIGTIGTVIAPNLAVMLPSRFVLGLAVGGASVTAPVYLSELAPTERRGMLTGRNELAIVFGQLLAFAVNAIIFAIWGGHDDVWRIMLAICAVPAICLFVGMLPMPESPRWLIAQGRTQDALAVLMQVRTRDRAEAEIGEITALAHRDRSAQAATISDIAIPWVRRLIVAAVIVAIAQQFTGINTVMYYGTQLLKDAGFSDTAATIANVADGMMAVVGSVVCLWFLIDRIPRRTLIVGGLIGVTLCHALIVIAAATLPDGTIRAYGVLVCVALLVLVMQTTLNVPVWVCLSELFPLRLRGLGMGISALVLWVMTAVVAQVFPILQDHGLPFLGLHAGISTTYGVFLVLGVVTSLLTYKTLPNTSDRSLEELESSFSHNDFR